MRWLKYGIGLLIACRAAATQVPITETPSLEEIARRYTRKTAGGVHLPIVRQVTESRRRGLASAIWLGDFEDLRYNVLMSIGGTTTPLLLDTGSSDLWVVSDKCTEGCSSSQSAYPQASFRYSGADAKLWDGDWTTSTPASGMIGKDTVTLAGLTLQDQYFVAVNQTSTSLGQTGSSGIFGLGFPAMSQVSYILWNQSISSISTNTEDTQQRLSPMTTVLRSWSLFGPFLSRLATAAQLTSPMYTVTLQRDAIQVGGNVGMLSIGEMPSGVSEDSLTWVPVRTYPRTQGGLPAPPDSPNEVYPRHWEVVLDDVYLDGVKLPHSTLSSPSITLSAVINSGDPILRGPADVVNIIQSKLGPNGNFPCSEPHTIAFSIGGKLFPVDSRDFIEQAFENDAVTCTSRLTSTDPPMFKWRQFSWSLGDPFLKSVLAAFYFGNITHPSLDPPRMGFLSTVPEGAASQLLSAVAAGQTGDNFPYISEMTPSGTFKPAGTASNGVPVATVTDCAK